MSNTQARVRDRRPVPRVYRNTHNGASTRWGFHGRPWSLMVKCGCAGGTCSCGLTSGRNVQITGTGSGTNPYVINATSTVMAGSTNVVVTGTGTANDPYVVTVPGGGGGGGSVVTAGARISVTGTGASGSPYVITGTHGYVLPGGNMTMAGVGSLADPYILTVAGTVAPTGGTLVRRANDGTAAVAPPTADDHAVNLGYFEPALNAAYDGLVALIEASRFVTADGNGQYTRPALGGPVMFVGTADARPVMLEGDVWMLTRDLPGAPAVAAGLYAMTDGDLIPL